MANFTRKLLPLLTISVLAACGGGGDGSSSNSTPSQSNNTSAQYHVAGQVQKGPFIFGSNIWISELDDKLSPTGKVYMTQTKDDLGNFGIPGTVGTKLVELTGSGYYMNELTGTLSTAPVTLNAVADLSVSKSLTINLLTTLQAPRLKTLMAGGADYQTAYTQSRNEVLAVFSIDFAKVDNLGTLFDMHINGASDQDSILLATSAILSQAARSQAPSAETAELSHLISTIASDLAEHGKLSSQSLQDQLRLAASQIDLVAVRRNVETYYASRGLKLVAPKFEEWIDKDGSTTLPKRLIDVAGLSFNNIADADPLSIYTSNPVKISSLKDDQSIPVQLTGNGTLIKNGVTTVTPTTAKNGDTLAIQTTSPYFGDQQQLTLKAGNTSTNWVVSSRNSMLIYDNTNYQSGNKNINYTPSSSVKYIAFTFQASNNTIARYAGIDSSQSSNIQSVSIYNDANGKPGSALITSNTKTTLFGNRPIASVNNQVKNAFQKNAIQFSLGSGGYTLEKGKTYWLVLQPSENSPINIAVSAGTNSTNMYWGSTRYSKDGQDWDICSSGVPYDRTHGALCWDDMQTPTIVPIMWLAQ
ncbi:hypothetical protein PWG14_21340 (plasmid) [Chromobacterium amazonense]|uniref:hypothetical protein n=1 Tax=Chromobacterium amazonense TaxID=1382803 RepID=UPI00237ED415|nr:hypothetical protein [Chromobacterium amazonense]MDE1715021.1 hypothetical protein [Chromobacterium amazonense]